MYPSVSSPSSHKIHSETEKVLDDRKRQGRNIGNEIGYTENNLHRSRLIDGEKH